MARAQICAVVRVWALAVDLALVTSRIDFEEL